jgi:hypothetical protein
LARPSADGAFAVPGTGGGKCHDELSSLECCGADDVCRSKFQCHKDQCAFQNCHKDAVCLPGTGPNEFACECKAGFKDMGAKAGYSCEARNHCSGDVAKCPGGCDCQSVTNTTVDGYFCHPKEGHITCVRIHHVMSSGREHTHTHSVSCDALVRAQVLPDQR